MHLSALQMWKLKQGNYKTCSRSYIKIGTMSSDSQTGALKLKTKGTKMKMNLIIFFSFFLLKDTTCIGFFHLQIFKGFVKQRSREIF